MTPDKDKVEAALGVFKDAIRYEVKAEADPGWIAELRQALTVLTEALAERERDAGRYRWLLKKLCVTDGTLVCLSFRAPDIKGIGLPQDNDFQSAIDAAMQGESHD